MRQNKILSLMTTFLIVFLSIFLPSLAFAQSSELQSLYEKAGQAYNAGHFEEAVGLYQQVVAIAPNLPQAYNGLGMAIKLSSGDSEEAIKTLKVAIAQDPKFVQAYENIGKIYYGDQDFDLAQEYFERALKLDPTSLEAKMNMGWIYLMAKGRPSKAIRYFKDVYAVSHTPMVLYGLGLSYFANNQREDALQAITDLRQMHQEELASRLEKAVRENRRVNIQPQDSSPKAKAEDSKKNVVVSAPQDTDPASTPAVGLKVRLRGKLSEL